MKHTGLLSLFCGIMLAVSVMTGCVAMPDGSKGPDYATIELGSVIAMTILVNEVESTQAVKNVTYARLGVLHKSLSCVSTVELTCPPFNMQVLPQMLANALPVEYQALAPAIIGYIESKAMLYYDLKIPQTENTAMVKKISIVVIGGAIQALAPHVSK